MSQSIRVNHANVYSRTARQNSSIKGQLNAMASQYSSIISALDGLDSATNAAMKTAMEQNQKKALAAAQIMEKLLSFIDRSARQMEMQDHRMASRFAKNER
jgi:hypothetical protein